MATTGERAARSLVRSIPTHPKVVILLTALLSLVALSQVVDLRSGAPRLLLDPSMDSMLPKGDPNLVYYERVKQLFSSGDSILVALVTEDIFTREHLATIQRIGERVEALDEVHYVSSLATALNIRNESGSLRIEPFYEDVPEDDAGLRELRERALSDPIYAGNLISLDGDVALMAVYLLDLPEQQLLDSKIDARIQAIAEDEAASAEIWMAGGAHVKAETTRLMLSDVFKVVPFALVVMGLVAYFSYRTLRGVAIPVLTVLTSVLWTMGYAAVAYEMLNPVTTAAPPVLIVVGFAYSIHVLSAYYAYLRSTPHRDWDRRAAVASSLGQVAVPVFLTGVTTAAGFFSLMTSPISAIKEFGAFCGIGVMGTMVVSLTLAPAVLVLLPLPAKLREESGDLRFDRFLEAIAHFDLRNRTRVLLGWAAVGVIALFGMSRIDIGTDMVSNFKTSNPVRIQFEKLNEELKGANGFSVILESEVQDDFKEPANLAVLESLQAWLAKQPEVGGSTSLADYIKVIHQGFRDGDPAYLAVPDSRELVSQLLVIGANDELDHFVDSDYAVSNIAVRTSAIDSADLMALARRIETQLAEVPSHLRATVTGNSVLVARTMDQIALGQALSLSAAMLIIYVILALLFTSFRVGFIALIPNALPVLVYFGVLGLSGVPLNVVTGLVACLVLGVAVDDTIHLLVHFNDEARRHADEEKGIVAAVKAVGRPVTYTTMALCLGFLVLTASGMKSQVEFGLLAAFTLAVAWLIDLTFTPSVAARMRIVTLWDLLTLDLGEEPHLTIPLFQGLKHREARITALMARLRNLPAGTQLFKLGDPGEDMYVVIDGSLAASIVNEGRRVKLRDLQRGDVIGEVALFSGERSADVETLTDVRLLRIGRPDLERLSRRYPKIGTRIYANLSAVLANRLATVTKRV